MHHRCLLAKLEAVGVVCEVHSWVNGFLNNRKQRVNIRGTYSQWLQVWSGVLQGSVLGPVLFLVYINDLLDDTQTRGKLFADNA